MPQFMRGLKEGEGEGEEEGERQRKTQRYGETERRRDGDTAT